MDLADLRAAMDTNGPEWSTLVAQDIDPESDVVRHRDDGTDSHAPLGIPLAQVIHHGTDHRSQSAPALTSLGISRRRSTSGTSPAAGPPDRDGSPRPDRRANSPRRVTGIDRDMEATAC